MGQHWGEPGRPHQDSPGCMGIAAPIVGVVRSVRAGWQPAAAYSACLFSAAYIAGQVARVVIG